MKKYFLLFIVLIINGCSSEKEDFVELQNELSLIENTIEQSYDYEFRISSSDVALEKIEKFLKSHNGSEYNKLGAGLKTIWEEKNQKYLKEKVEIESLFFKKLGNMLRKEAFRIHPASKIEAITEETITTKKDNLKLHSIGKYSVRMKGAFLGIHVFKIEIKYEAEMDIVNKSFNVISLESLE